ncbi:unnamed protein product [Caenorhabditis angaria]|uniref:[histone H4]-lysine(20) N-methyltransferase n=1 Tax=Caenorhabditis angaria TaxID=860376 RepID=A0A9P1IG31_9PELO|nr:unnamed protein product [Caenorhabditis angaria]
MTVAAAKRTTSAANRSKKRRGGGVSNTANSYEDHQQATNSSNMANTQATKSTRARRTAVKDVSNHKITEFFQVRRSNRKTSKQIEEEEKDALRDALATGCNEKMLEIYTDPIKGRGIRAGRIFNKGDFVVEYKGDMMDYSVAKQLEEEYSNDEKIGSYMYFFTWNNKKWCIDATKESKYKGRLINHSVLRPNLKTKVVEFDGSHHLILVAKRTIEEGEELLYDYGDRTAATIAKNPWLVNTKFMTNPILNVVVVSFHHKRGCEVEYSHPPLNGPGENGLPDEWHLLPSLALPDGVHNCQKDTIFFMLPSINEKDKCVFGLSCYRQIDANELLHRPDDVTRTSVQKSVVVITRIPLFGALKAKLEVITQAYFEQRDFAKVEVLAQMYTNLCDIFDENLTGEYFASLALHEISVQDLFIRFRHRALLLFKLFLLERKILFIAPSANRIGETMLAAISLFPKVLEEGLYYSNIGLFSNQEPKIQQNPKPKSNPDEIVIEEDIGVELARNDPMPKDSFGFPLSLFGQGSYFDPYLSIQFMDSILKVKSCSVGATNALFSMKKEMFDVIVKIEDDGNIVHNHVDFVNEELEKICVLTTADLRFADFVLKKVEEQMKSSTAEFDGSDEWVRIQIRNYLLSILSTSKSDLQSAIPHFGVAFINLWRKTKNYRIWMAKTHSDIVSVPPGHMFSEQQGVYDVYLKLEHAVNGVEGASKVFGSVNTAGKNIGNSIGETGSRVKAKFSNWWKGRQQQQQQTSSSSNSVTEEGIEAIEEDRK